MTKTDQTHISPGEDSKIDERSTVCGGHQYHPHVITSSPTFINHHENPSLMSTVYADVKTGLGTVMKAAVCAALLAGVATAAGSMGIGYGAMKGYELGLAARSSAHGDADGVRTGLANGVGVGGGAEGDTLAGSLASYYTQYSFPSVEDEKEGWS